MIEETTVLVEHCLCEVCLSEWLHPNDKLPEFCRNMVCRSRNWNGLKPRRRSHVDEISFPAPRRAGRPRASAAFDDDGEDL